MKKKYLRFWEIGLVFAGIMVLFSMKATAVGTLITISSATYDSGDFDYAQGVAIDSNDNIIVAGYTDVSFNYDWFTIKYNQNLVAVSSISYNSGDSDYAQGVAIDSNDNIIVTGKKGSGYSYFTIKYDRNLVVVSSVSYDSGRNDYARGVAIDSNDNIIVTGYTDVSFNYDWFTIKYNQNLVAVSSVSYDSGGNDYAQGVAIDSNDNIIVAGHTNDYFTSDWLIIKYNQNLVVVSSVSYDKGISWDCARGVAVDNNDNIIVAGYNNNISDCFTIKYDSNLLVLSSATYNGPTDGSDSAHAVAVDNDGNIIVTGYSDDGFYYDWFTIKYNQNLMTLSSATCNGPANYSDRGYGVVVDSSNNIIVTGYNTNVSNRDCFTIKYNGSPMISSVFPAYCKRGKTLDVTINGLNFYPGVGVTFSGDGITVNSVLFVSATRLKANITINEGASPGMRNITVTNTDEVRGIIRAAFEVRALEMVEVGVKIQGGEKGYANPAKGEEVTIYFKSASAGEIKIKIYTLKGQLICKKSKETYGEEDSIVWDCKNSDGTVVSSGIYVIYIDAPGIKTTKKIAILK